MDTPLIELLESRKASRAISEKKLHVKSVNKLMHSAQLSASCSNNQPWRFLFLSDEAALEKGRSALSRGNSWAMSAPLLIIGFTKPDLDCQTRSGRDYYLFDLGMAIQLILLQATELDLIARPMAGFSAETVKTEFHIPDEYEVYVMVAIGYEGNIENLDEKKQKISLGPRIRNPIETNFFRNVFKEYT